MAGTVTRMRNEKALPGGLRLRGPIVHLAVATLSTKAFIHKPTGSGPFTAQGNVDGLLSIKNGLVRSGEVK